MPEGSENYSIILFDGVCNFCNSSVNFVIRHDKKNKFKFAALQSEKGIALLKKYNIDPTKMSTGVLIESNKAYTRSTIALRICKKMDGLYPLLYGFIIVPPFIRNFIYDWIARNRYRWFGKKDSCMIPTEEVKQRFVF